MKIKFLMAEEVRPELGGKLSLLGLFPDDVVLLTSARPDDVPPDIPEGLERLTFLISLSEMEGEHKFKGGVFDPSGEPYNPAASLGEGVIEKGTSRSFIIEMKPFVIKSCGVYRFDFYVDDSITSFPFEIREQATK